LEFASSPLTYISTAGLELKPNTKNMNLKDRFNLDSILEVAILAVAAILAIKLFGGLLDVVLFVALGVIVYVGIRNRDLLMAKLKKLQEKAKDLV